MDIVRAFWRGLTYPFGWRRRRGDRAVAALDRIVSAVDKVREDMTR